jgi:hypothetical protein
MKVRIYRPSKATTQSGLARTKGWILEAESETPRGPEPLMGWTAAGDTLPQIRLNFQTSEAAESYAREQGWEYTIAAEHNRIIRPRNYADNFRYSPPVSNTGK